MTASVGSPLRLVLVLLGLVLAVSGCSTARTGASAPVAAATAPTPHPAPAAAPSGPDTIRTTTADNAYPNINKVPDRPKSKLMTPEETQKVIAELEALAKAQGAPVARTSAAAAAACDKDVSKSLDPEAPIKLERAGQGC